MPISNELSRIVTVKLMTAGGRKEPVLLPKPVIRPIPSKFNIKGWELSRRSTEGEHFVICYALSIADLYREVNKPWITEFFNRRRLCR
jgi:hypothetical protein